MPEFSLDSLPVASVLADIVAASRAGPVVVTAPPGSGKTMLVPAAVHDDLPAASRRLILLQPRRLPARSVAGQIARLRGGTVGGEVGYQVRFDSRVSRETTLVVETTGILLRRLLDDVTLDGIAAVILDEFHERSAEMDLILGMLVRLRQTVRPDLRVIVMSATLDAGPVAARLGAASVITATGRPFPVEVRFLPHGRRPTTARDLPDAVSGIVPEALRKTTGHLLVFLPGVGEIHATARLLEPLARREGHAIVPLFGDLPPERQDDALAETGRRKIILATNIAETSLTIPGVTAVIDSGLARQQQVTPATGLPQLVTVPISQAAAEQRAGRAGRTGPGICWRLWDEAGHRQRPTAETPEVLRGDLCRPLLTLAAVGEADDFPWLDPPPAAAAARDRKTLGELGCLQGNAAAAITPLGRQVAGLPAHPRLATLLLAAAARGVLREASLAAALLSERDPFRAGGHRGGGPRDHHQARSRCDLFDRVLALQHFHATGNTTGVPGLPPLHPGGARGLLRTAEQLYRLAAAAAGDRAVDVEAAFRETLLVAFPDRLCRLRPGSTDRGTMVGGRGVRLDRGSRLRQEPFFLAIDVDDAASEVRVRLASAVEPDWLRRDDRAANRLASQEELFFNPSRRQVEARHRLRWLDLVLEETPLAVSDTAAAAVLLAAEAAKQPAAILPAADTPAGGLLARARWLASRGDDCLNQLPTLLPPLDNASLLARLPELCQGMVSLAELKQANWLGWLTTLLGYETSVAIDQLAPASLELATSSRHPIDYTIGDQPRVSIRIQELFGTSTTPLIAGGRVPLLIELLGPNHRPQQLTSDLASFWANTYPDIKKELKRRYPKHAWPDDPLTAAPIRSGLKRHAR